jgi:phage recombination protein Bet
MARAASQEKNPTEPGGPRFPVPARSELERLGIDEAKWRVLSEMTFPSARTPEALVMVLEYCRARGLDPLKRPVHIVPMWSAALGREVETVWPGINEVQTTAARTGLWAGMDSPRFGPEVSRAFRGRRRSAEAWEDVELSLTFPSWCEVTVYRLVNGQRCPFSEPVFWLEAYSRAGGARSELPNDMWVKRPRGQLLKCAKAASLRAAFPEEADYTAEEMEGKVIDAGVAVPEEGSSAGASSDGEPSASEAEDPDPVTLPSEVRIGVHRLVARTVAAQAWEQADAYAATRWQGAALAYARRELARARRERETNTGSQAA